MHETWVSRYNFVSDDNVIFSPHFICHVISLCTDWLNVLVNIHCHLHVHTCSMSQEQQAQVAQQAQQDAMEQQQRLEAAAAAAQQAQQDLLDHVMDNQDLGVAAEYVASGQAKPCR